MSTKKRKDDHLRICAEKPVQFREKRTGFESIEFVHQALPEMDFDEIDLSTELFGKKLNYPIILAAITGISVSFSFFESITPANIRSCLCFSFAFTAAITIPPKLSPFSASSLPIIVPFSF